MASRMPPGDSSSQPAFAEEWRQTLATMDRQGLHRRIRTQATPPGPEIEREGRRLVNLASNDYLGLAGDPRLIAAAQEGLRRWGAGAGASPLVTGHLRVHEELEEALAEFKRTKAALVFSSGYATNVGVLSTLAGPRDQVFADALNHASLIDGCRLSRAAVHRYRHGDPGHLEDLLRAAPARGQKVIVTDSVFSMDGDVAPLADLADLADQWGGVLVVDDAHGTGVAGREGRGVVHHLGLEDRVPVQIGTLSKALGCQGGFVAGSRLLVDLLVHKGRSFVYSTAIAPALAAGALAALEIVRSEEWRRTAQRAHLARLRQSLSSDGFRLLGEELAPLAAVAVGEAEAASALASRLEAAGVLAPAFRPPTVPEGSSRIRIAPMATHTAAQIETALGAFREAGASR